MTSYEKPVGQEWVYRRLTQNPLCIWLTGLSAAGKSTLAFALEQRLSSLGHACFVIDGDKVRGGLCRDLGFSNEDRNENIRRVAEVARMMNDAGLIGICALISPLRNDRQMAREIIGGDRFREVHVCTPISICEQRDPKGLYGKARSGILQEFTGISAPYEPPEAPHICIDTARTGRDESVDLLVSELFGRGGQ